MTFENKLTAKVRPLDQYTSNRSSTPISELELTEAIWLAGDISSVRLS